MCAALEAPGLDCGGEFPHGFFRFAPGDTEKLPSDLQENPVFNGEVDRFPFSDSGRRPLCQCAVPAIVSGRFARRVMRLHGVTLFPQRDNGPP